MDLVGERDRGRFRDLAEELENALCAVELRSEVRPAEENLYIQRASPWLEYEKIVEAAVALMRSDYASMQMLFPERGAAGELLLLSFRGFNPQAAKFWKWVRADSKSTCGMALRDNQRVVAPEIAACDFMADSEDQKVYLQTGIHACQTTPLIASGGAVVGMISTLWRTPHQPSAKEFRVLDLLARQASALIERRRKNQEAHSRAPHC